MVENVDKMTPNFNKSKITVAISLFNYGHFIEQAIESVCKQTISSEIDLVIVDDASTDNSVNIVEKYKENNKSLISGLASFHCEIHKQNKGLAEARNTAFEIAKTDNILVLDADNYLLPQACNCLLKRLNRASKSIGAMYPILAVEGHSYQRIANELPWDRKRFCTGNYIDAMALVRREAWKFVGVLNTRQVAGKILTFGAVCRVRNKGRAGSKITWNLSASRGFNEEYRNQITQFRITEITATEASLAKTYNSITNLRICAALCE